MSGGAFYFPPSTNLPAFTPISEKDPINGQTYEFQSITKMPAYSALTFEKLRYDDYMEQRKKQKLDLVSSALFSERETTNEFFQRFDVSAEKPSNSSSAEQIDTNRNSYLSLYISSIYHQIISGNNDSVEHKTSDVTIVMEDSL